MAVYYPAFRLEGPLPAGTNNIGDVDIVSMPTISETLLVLLGTGRIAVPTPGTAVAIIGGTTTKAMLLVADQDNTGRIYVGKSTVSSANGLRLEPGASVVLPVNNAAERVYIDAQVASDSISAMFFA